MVSVRNIQTFQGPIEARLFRVPPSSPASAPSSPDLSSADRQDQQVVLTMLQYKHSQSEPGVFSFVDAISEPAAIDLSSEEKKAAYKADLKPVSNAPSEPLQAFIRPETLQEIETQSLAEAEAKIARLTEKELRAMPLMGLGAAMIASAQFGKKAVPLDIEKLKSMHTHVQASRLKFEKIQAALPKECGAFLGLNENGTNRPQLAQLIKTLYQQGQLDEKELNQLHAIAQSHGAETLESVSQSVNALLEHPTDLLNAEQKVTVVQGILSEVAYPTRIDQRNKGTCPAAAIQMKWAIEQPANYARALSLLAQNTHSDLLLEGSQIEPNNTWADDSHDYRSLSTQIMQNAIMNLADPDHLGGKYNSAIDEGTVATAGLESSETHEALQRIMGNVNFDLDLATDLFSTQDDLVAYIEDDLARGNAVVASFEEHAVLIVGMDKTVQPHQVILASWGEQYTMDVDRFKQHLKSVQNVDHDGLDNHKISANSKCLLSQP